MPLQVREREREREIVGVSLACGVRSEIMNAVVVVSK